MNRIARLTALPVFVLLTHARPASAQESPRATCQELGVLMLGQSSTSGAVCKVNLPRTDLSVSLLGATLPPGAGLTSWAAFLPVGDSSLVMGDLALTGNELPAVMQGLVAAGFNITAVHRHMLGETPEMSFMHYAARGDSRALAKALRSVLPVTRQPAIRSGDAMIGTAGVVIGIPCGRIAQEFPGASLGSGPGFCKVTIPRADLAVSIGGLRVPAAMGIASWVAFREVPDQAVTVITGDLALQEERVPAALAAVLEAGIDVVSMHNHMAGESPRIVFFHFQARGNPLILAQALHTALSAEGDQ